MVSLIVIWFVGTEMTVVDCDGDTDGVDVGVGGGGGNGNDSLGDIACRYVVIEPSNDCFDDNENETKSL